MASRRVLAGLAATAVLAAGCSGTAPGARSALARGKPKPASSPPPSTTVPKPLSSGAAAGAGRRRPLTGRTIGIDPGHNGRNFSDPSFVNHTVWNGRAEEACDTTGTETDGGYTEARFTFKVATYLAADLRRLGAHVVLTRTNNNGVGPCVDRRARIIDRAHADVAVDIHADGGPPAGRGFTVIEPVADAVNRGALAASIRFGAQVRRSLLAATTMPVSTYDGTNGIARRDDLAGLNLTTVPKVLVECGNMRNPTDAALLVSNSFQKRLASAFASAVTHDLRDAP